MDMNMNADLDAARRQLRDQGWAVVPNVLSAGMITQLREALDRAVAEMRRHGLSTHTAMIDPNEANVRVYSLPDWNPVFIELLRNPVARALVQDTLGPGTTLSNFVANIALPGSKSMKLHSDQALTVPPPWSEPWAMNLIWCLDDVYEANGATRYLPGSHNYQNFEDVPGDALARMVAFSAPAGSLIAMEGRLWHTSGANVTADKTRAMMFAYYVKDFVRQQMNWEAVLSPEKKATLDADAREILGLGPVGNFSLGIKMLQLDDSSDEFPDVTGGDKSALGFAEI